MILFFKNYCKSQKRKEKKGKEKGTESSKAPRLMRAPLSAIFTS